MHLCHEEFAMKARVAMILAGAVVMLAGCASTSNNYAREGRYAAPALENDMHYVLAVEAAAKRAGVDVVWIHPRRKPAPTKLE
jgi:uncharacterized lipoprotein YajG